MRPVSYTHLDVYKRQVRKKTAQQVYQTTILIPHLVSTVLIGYLVYAFLSSTNGFVNKGILEPLGKEGVQWYTEAKYWPFILTIVQTLSLIHISGCLRTSTLGHYLYQGNAISENMIYEICFSIFMLFSIY